jgi:hypothetical protein
MNYYINSMFRPFVASHCELKEPQNSGWCASVCWDIALGAFTRLILKLPEEKAKNLIGFDRGYGISYLYGGFVDSYINGRHLAFGAEDLRLVGNVDSRSIQQTVLAQLRHVISLFEPDNRRISFLTVRVEEYSENLARNVALTVSDYADLYLNVYRKGMRGCFISFRPYYRDDGDYFHRVAVIGNADNTRHHDSFLIADPEKGDALWVLDLPSFTAQDGSYEVSIEGKRKMRLRAVRVTYYDFRS